MAWFKKDKEKNEQEPVRYFSERETNNDDVDSVMEPSDFKNNEEYDPNNKDDQDIVKLLMSRVREASFKQEDINRQVMEGRAGYDGHQFHKYNKETGITHRKAESSTFTKEPNYAAAVIDKNTSRACASFPDIWIGPASASKQDMMAAETARKVQQHMKTKCDLKKFIRDVALDIQIGSTVFGKLRWDATARAAVSIPYVDQEGNQGFRTSYKNEGDLYLTYIDSCSMYLDPICKKSCHEGDWIIEKSIWSSTKIQSTFPKRGRYVTTRKQSITDVFLGKENKTSTAVELFEMWEKPSYRYPKGRYIIVANDILLRAENWPLVYMSLDDNGRPVKGDPRCEKFPYAEIKFGTRTDSPFSSNLISRVQHSCETLGQINTKLASKIWLTKTYIEHLIGEKIRPEQLNQEVSLIPVATLGSIKITQISADVGPLLAAKKDTRDEVEYLSGVNRVVGDDGPPANMSGTAIEKLQLDDKSRLILLVLNLESGLKDLFELGLALFEQYGCNVDRLLCMDSCGLPENPADIKPSMERVLMESLIGGEYSLLTYEGSGLQKEPAMVEEWLQNVFQMGGFGQGPDAVSFFLDMSQMIRSDAKKDDLISKLREHSQQNGIPGKMAAQELATQQQLDILKAKGQIDLQIDAQKQANQAQSQEAASKYGADQQIRVNESKSLHPNINISATTTLDALATAGLEQMVGLPAGDGVSPQVKGQVIGTVHTNAMNADTAALKMAHEKHLASIEPKGSNNG